MSRVPIVELPNQNHQEHADSKSPLLGVCASLLTKQGLDIVLIVATHPCPAIPPGPRHCAVAMAGAEPTVDLDDLREMIVRMRQLARELETQYGLGSVVAP